MKQLILIAMSMMTLMVAGCGPIYETNYSYVPPRSNPVRNCIAYNCQRNKMLCQQNCSDSNISCERQASQDARVSFRQYAKSQRKQRLPIIKSVSDFKDDSQCHASCGCDSVYRQCYQTCGGQVLANTVCVAFCDQKSK